MSAPPLVSVNMITYNHARYIAQAIECALKQETDFPFELVIGEDCSTDGTREIVFDYRKRYPEIIKVVTSDKNVGARKNGLRTERACRGKYIGFCEGDDYWHHPQKLQMQVDYLESHPEVGFVHGDADRAVVATGELIRNQHKGRGATHDDEDEDLPWAILASRYDVYTCTVCARKALLDEIVASNPYELQSEHFLMGDTPRWFELARLARVRYMDVSLATMNALPESASRSRDVRRRIRFKKSGRELRMHYIGKYECPSRMKSAIVEVWNTNLLVEAFRAGDLELAQEAMNELRRSGVHIKPAHYFRFCGAHPLIHGMLLPVRCCRRALLRIVGVCKSYFRRDEQRDAIDVKA